MLLYLKLLSFLDGLSEEVCLLFPQKKWTVKYSWCEVDFLTNFSPQTCQFVRVFGTPDSTSSEVRLWTYNFYVFV